MKMKSKQGWKIDKASSGEESLQRMEISLKYPARLQLFPEKLWQFIVTFRYFYCSILISLRRLPWPTFQSQ
jgi:hypothetical protein